MTLGRKYTPADLLKAAWRRRWLIAVTFVALAAVAYSVVIAMPRAYRSLATLQVVSASDAYVRSPAQANVTDRLSSIGQTTLTRQRLETIIKDLDLYPQLRQVSVMENVVETMRGDITFTSTDRDVFVLGFTATDPTVAKAVAERLTSLFLEENARSRGQRAEAASSFLDAQLADARKKMDEQQRRVEEFQTRNATELPSQLSLNLQELSNVQFTLRSVLESVTKDQDRRMAFQLEQSTLDAVVPTGSGSGSTSGGSDAAYQVADQIEAARATLRDLELRLTSEHPDVQRMKRVITRLEQQQATDTAALAGGAVASGTLRRRDPIRSAEIQKQMAALDQRIVLNQAEARRLQARIDLHTGRINAAPAREAELAALTRDQEDAKKLYSSLLARQQDATMAADAERKDIGDQFRVIEAAQLPERPYGRGRTTNLIFGLIAAFMLSLGLAAAIEYHDSRLRTEEDITLALRLPVLATIPTLGTAPRGRMLR